MATIHFFPTELIRHVLSLAYSPGEKGSGKGLCATGLVHSTWTGPSRSVMTEKLVFGPVHERPTRLFIERGPAKCVCQSVEFGHCSNGDLGAVLARVAANSVTDLRLTSMLSEPFKHLFEIECLDASGLSSRLE